jgi:hypothetical protein
MDNRGMVEKERKGTMTSANKHMARSHRSYFHCHKSHKIKLDTPVKLTRWQKIINAVKGFVKKITHK